MAVTIGFVIGIFGLMWFVGTRSPLTKNEKFDSISIDPINPLDSSVPASAVSSAVPASDEAQMLTVPDLAHTEAGLKANLGGGKSNALTSSSLPPSNLTTALSKNFKTWTL